MSEIVKLIPNDADADFMADVLHEIINRGCPVDLVKKALSLCYSERRITHDLLDVGMIEKYEIQNNLRRFEKYRSDRPDHFDHFDHSDYFDHLKK